jgi:transposase-like protein
MKGKRYPKEFKDQLIQEAMETGDVGQVAKRHEITTKSLYRWISESKHKAWQNTSSGAKKTAVGFRLSEKYSHMK